MTMKSSQQSVVISMGKNYAPLLGGLFLYANKAELIQNIFHDTGKMLQFLYIDNVLFNNNAYCNLFQNS
jgi:hypothetical protein